MMANNTNNNETIASVSAASSVSSSSTDEDTGVDIDREATSDASLRPPLSPAAVAVAVVGQRTNSNVVVVAPSVVEEPKEEDHPPPAVDEETTNNGRGTTTASTAGIWGADKRRVSERNNKKQQSKESPPNAAAAATATFGAVASSPATAATIVAADTKQILEEQMQNHLQQQQQQEQQQHVSSSISSTVGGSSQAAIRDETAVAPGEAPSTALTIHSTTAASTTRPGAVHIRGWGRRVRGDDDFSDSESTESREIEDFSSSAAHPVETTTSRRIFSALLVDEDEVQHRAESLFQQMLAQTAVAERVDEEEMRRQAHEQAALEFHEQQQRLKDKKEIVSQDGVTINKNNKRQQRLRIIAGCFFFMGVVIIVVVVTAVLLQQRGGGDDAAAAAAAADAAADAAAAAMPTSSITPSAIPSFSPSTTPSVSFPPSTPPSSMPSAASHWRQIGNSMIGIHPREQFGMELGFSADGNTVVATARESWNGTHATGHVRAYTYHNETDEWKQLGQYITRGFECEYCEFQLCLSPNGKFLGVFSYSTAMLRVYALRDNQTKMNATTTEDGASSAISWEQIGPDIVHVISGASLTDNLVLAIASEGLVYIYQFDANQSDWIRMGQEINMDAATVQLVLNKSTGRLFLAVGGCLSARTFQYEPDTDSWIQFGSELRAEDDDDSYDSYRCVWISLSMDGETITVGRGDGIALLRTFSYDAVTDNWILLGKDLKYSSFEYGDAFSLSANGKVLVVTTQEVDVILQEEISYTIRGAIGQVRTWDFIANDQSYGGASDGGGEWIQRGEAALEVGTLESQFGYKIALSADGNRLATSAIDALNDQGGHRSGKVRVFEQY